MTTDWFFKLLYEFITINKFKVSYVFQVGALVITRGCNLHKCIYYKGTNVLVLPPVIQRHGLNIQSPYAFFNTTPISNAGTFLPLHGSIGLRTYSERG